MKLEMGGKYNWINQPERLVYLGRSGGGWHQFALVDSPDDIWCEVLDLDVNNMERSVEVYGD